MSEQTDYSDPKVLAKMDTAIEIMATKINITSLRILAEEEKENTQRDEHLINRLKKEMTILLKERERMYMGDENVKNKIFQQYAPEVKTYFERKQFDAR